MRIGIDIRPLLDKEPSGVGEYTREIIRALFEIDRENEYHLFANAYAKTKIPSFENERAAVHLSRIPNKLLNASMRFLNYPVFYAANRKSCDIFWMPNINFAALDSRTPLVLTIHDLSFKLMPDFYSKKQRLWHHLIGPDALIQKARKIIVPSIQTKADLVMAANLPEEKIAVINHGIAEEFFTEPDEMEIAAVRNRYNLPPQFILCLAELGPRKNIDSVLESFNLLKKDPRFIGLHLVLAGKVRQSPRRPLNNSRLSGGQARKLFNDVKFLGYVPREHRRALYKMAEIFIYPSYYEGFGLPPLEAQACGTPVIASNRGALPEILGTSAILIDPYNTEDIVSAARAIILRRSLYEKLKNAGSNNAKKFSWRASAQKTLDTLKAVALSAF